MGVDVADAHPAARAVFDSASEVLGLDLLAVCRDGPASELVRTDLQQPAILAAGAAVVAALRATKALDESDLVACFGLSLGEFTALHAAGALSLEDALHLVRERGLGMQEASERISSTMLALRAEVEAADALCRAARAETNGVVGIANLNAPGQVVISGDTPSIEAAERLAKEHGIRRPVRLPVAGAFHSALMQPGAARLERALGTVTIQAPRVPVIANVTAEATTDPDVIRQNLILQVTHPVRFVECVQTAVGLGAQRVIEPAPGRVLAGLIRRIDGELQTDSVPDEAAVAALAAAGEHA
jgi:[acyl-carrier-protein] S-malonyltransferase